LLEWQKIKMEKVTKECLLIVYAKGKMYRITFLIAKLTH
jgi:hypothetical protein